MGGFMKYFCVSDIHGHYDVLVENLKEKGWDPSNIGHKLIVIGDMVDRGPQNKEVLEFVYQLRKENKAILIMGNHDMFLLDFFKGIFNKTVFNFKYNGHKETIDQLLGYQVSQDSNFKEEQSDLLKKYPHIFQMLQDAPYYYEVDKYIFVHGGVDASLADWRNDTTRNMTWNSQAKMEPIEGRVVVCGHKQNVSLRAPNNYKEYLEHPTIFPNMFNNLYLKGSIHIDGSVMATKKVNVLVLDIK